jgi:ATP diphosphatase
MKPSRDISRLVEIMAALRTPGTGCPWDLQQDFKTIAPYTIEEAYEVADAIDRGDMEELKLELGDLLLQSVYHSRMAEEAGHFDFSDVVEAITRKMIRRHPHVFGDAQARSAGSAKGQWERIKAEEKAELAAAKAARGYRDPEGASILDDVPSTLPGLMVAVKLQARAGKVGFDWNDPRAVIAKIREELDEVEAELDTGLRSQIWRGTCIWTRRARCAAPMPSSASVSTTSSATSPALASPSRRQRSTRWKRSGRKQSRKIRRNAGRLYAPRELHGPSA